MGDPDADNAAQERSLALTRSIYGPDICGAFRPAPDGFTLFHGLDDCPCVRRAGHVYDHIDADGDEWPRASDEETP